MFKIFKKKEYEEDGETEEKGQFPPVLQELDWEEESLLNEQQELLDMKEKLNLRIAEEAEARKRRIETLTHENSELRRQCEELSNSLNLLISKNSADNL